MAELTMLIACCSDSDSPVFGRVARMLAAVDPELVLFAGDARADGFGIGPMRARRWRRTWGPLADRVVTVPGNHDHRDGRSWTHDGAWGDVATFRRHESGAFVLQHDEVTVLGFDSGARADAVAPLQVAWAHGVLSDRIAPGRAPTLAVVHAPAFPVSEHISSSLDQRPGARDRFWADLEDLDVCLVLSGHEHLYARRVVHRRRPITQVIAAGAGAVLSPPLATDLECAAAAHHALLLDVGAGAVSGRAVTLDGETIDRFEIAGVAR